MTRVSVNEAALRKVLDILSQSGLPALNLAGAALENSIEPLVVKPIDDVLTEIATANVIPVDDTLQPNTDYWLCNYSHEVDSVKVQLSKINFVRINRRLMQDEHSANNVVSVEVMDSGGGVYTLYPGEFLYNVDPT